MRDRESEREREREGERETGRGRERERERDRRPQYRGLWPFSARPHDPREGCVEMGEVVGPRGAWEPGVAPKGSRKTRSSQGLRLQGVQGLPGSRGLKGSRASSVLGRRLFGAGRAVALVGRGRAATPRHCDAATLRDLRWVSWASLVRLGRSAGYGCRSR